MNLKFQFPGPGLYPDKVSTMSDPIQCASSISLDYRKEKETAKQINGKSSRERESTRMNNAGCNIHSASTKRVSERSQDERARTA